MLPGVTHEEAQEIAERLRVAIEQARPTGIQITISLGLSAASGEDVVYETLFKAADLALYEAKRTGRNRVVAAPAPPAASEAQSLEVVVGSSRTAPALLPG